MSESERLLTTELGSVSIRENQDGDGRTLDGLALPWGAEAIGTREYGSDIESFAPGSFRQAIRDRAGKPIPYMDEHADGTRHIVGMVSLREAEDGLRFGGRLLSNQAAVDYAERVAAGADGVSVQFLPGAVRRGPRSVTHTAVRSILALAGTYAPAYAGAAVALREDNVTIEIRETEPPAPMPEPEPKPTPEPEPPASRAFVKTELESLRRELAETVSGRYTNDPYSKLAAYRSLGAILQASYADTELRDTFSRALADNITSESPGVMAGGNVVQDVKRIIAASRPGIDAWGGAVALGGSGMTVDYPYITVALATLVGVQATQKSEITSADVPILKGTANIVTLAGGSDIALQLIRRSSPSYLDAYGRILFAAYAAVSDALFVDAVEATAGLGTGVIDFATATADQIRTALFNASVAVQTATGSPASFVLASATAFSAIGGKLNPQGVGAGQQGSSTASELQPNMAGLPIILDTNVNAGTVLVSNRSTAAWHEDGPFTISATDVAKLGENRAIYGMGATAVYNPAGIVKSSAV